MAFARFAATVLPGTSVTVLSQLAQSRAQTQPTALTAQQLMQLTPQQQQQALQQQQLLALQKQQARNAAKNKNRKKSLG